MPKDLLDRNLESQEEQVLPLFRVDIGIIYRKILNQFKLNLLSAIVPVKLSAIVPVKLSVITPVKFDKILNQKSINFIVFQRIIYISHKCKKRPRINYHKAF